MIILESLENWQRPETVIRYINMIFSEETIQNEIISIIQNASQPVDHINKLLEFLNRHLLEQIQKTPQKSSIYEKSHKEFKAFEDQIINNLTAYQSNSKPNPKAVFWPNPDRHPEESPYNQNLIINKIPLVNKKTKIGSLGSCFAFEISKYLKQNGYNYYIAEKGHDPESGILEESFKPGQEHERFSAAWGIVFNTATFKQIADASFGIQELPKIVIPLSNNDFKFWADPFREGIVYTSLEAYENNYSKHLAASRDALSSCEVFILTLGLNECWEYIPTGSIISRNPHSQMLSTLMKPVCLSFERNVSNMNSFIRTVREHNPKIKFIISVSPVPLIATFKAHEQHVMTANAHSKSMMRVVAEEIVQTNEDCYYFPSYELVTQTTKEPWLNDLRHVSPETVESVMKMFEETFGA